MPVGPGDDVAAPLPARLRPTLDLVEGGAQDALLDGLALTVQLLELEGEPPRVVGVLGEQQLECGLRPAEAARGVDARRQAEADRTLVAGCRVDACDGHQRAEPRPLRLRETPEPGEGQRPALVDERDDVGDGRERDDIEVAVEEGVARPEERLCELPDDGSPAEALERIVALERGHDGAVGKGLAGPVVVGDHDLEAEVTCSRHLLDRGDPAIHGENELNAFTSQTRQRLAGQSVSLLEARGQVPRRVSAELAEQEDGQCGGADPVGVVVAVDADAGAARDSGPDCGDGLPRVAERVRIVSRQGPLEEGAGGCGIGVAAPDEHRRRRPAEAELGREQARLLSVGGRKLPGGVLHRTIEGTEKTGQRWRDFPAYGSIDGPCGGSPSRRLPQRASPAPQRPRPSSSS